MILEIDAGNTRIKWRLAGGDSAGDVQAQGHIPVQGNTALAISGLFEEFESSVMQTVRRVRISSVRGADFNSDIKARFSDTWSLSPEFAKVEKHCGGVTNSYSEISTMGVDRWLAMLAAFSKEKGPCCVLDFGSAVTFDRIDKNGIHLGGYIVPGLHLMRESLARKAPALDIGPVDWDSHNPGNSTQSAMSGGILAMLTGFADFCHQQVNIDEDEVHWFLTGGDAELLGKQLSWQHRVEKDLVLDGLALSLP